MTTSDPFEGAGVTALGLAASRSVESSRTDRLFDDPQARSLFERARDRLPMRVEWPRPGEEVTDAEALHLHGSRYIAVRTRSYDDRLLEAIARGVRQVVLLGAGLDTRAQRLALPSDLTIYELDRPDLLEWKTAALAACGSRSRCAVRSEAADLADTAWTRNLEAAAFDPAQPTLWIAEGALPYLDAAAQSQLARAIAKRSAPGSTFCFDQIRGGDTRALSDRSGLDMESLLQSTDGEDHVVSALEGWEIESRPVGVVAATFGRDLSDPFAAEGGGAPPWLDTVFVMAQSSAFFSSFEASRGSR